MILGKRSILSIAAGATLAVAGCGGASKSTVMSKFDLISTADAICAHFFVEYHAHGTSNQGEFARKVLLIASYERAEADELSRLKPPPSIAGDWAQILAWHRASVAESVQASRYIQRKRNAAGQALLLSGLEQQGRVARIAKRDGFKDCARTA